MNADFLEVLRKKYKLGWYKKGKVYRYLLTFDYAGMIVYRSKSAMKNNLKTVWRLNPDYDDWFTKAEYVGLELEAE